MIDNAFFAALVPLLGDPYFWMVVVACAVFGVFFGAIPGLSATMSVALFVPVAYWLDPTVAIAGIVTLVAGAIFAGDIPTVLLRVPGTPASAAYADEAFALTRRGAGQRLLKVALLASVFGGILGALILSLVGRPLAQVASMFSSAEYLWLYLIGLASAVYAASGPKALAWASLTIGLLISTIGLGAAHPLPRFTFGASDLYVGVSFIPAMIGLFGLSEVFAQISRKKEEGRSREQIEVGESGGGIVEDFLRRLPRRSGRLSVAGCLGALVGMLPGAGADIAGWLSYASSKPYRNGSTEDEKAGVVPEEFDRISNASASNSSALAGGWVPSLVFGIPGDSITAIALGVLLMKNITLGPLIFVDQTEVVYGIYLTFIIANLVLIPVGLLAIRTSSLILRVPKCVLYPLIVVFCVTGAFALNGSLFDVMTMFVMGLLGWGMHICRIPVGPAVLGIVLGGAFEERFLQVASADGSLFHAFLGRPIALGLAVVFLCLLAFPLITARLRKKLEHA